MAVAEAIYKAGDTVEGFRVHALLGQGAASQIYLVQDPKTKQIFALKHVHRGDAKDARFLDQAIQEYQIASKLNHPNLRKIERLIKKTRRLLHLTDVFLLMEHVDGVSMERRPPKNFDEALQIFGQTARALAHMHARGFIHADMKPNNIIVCHAEDQPAAKIIDLGQSCATGTVKSRIQGTPDYIAPEQVHRRPITPQTDIYNLGTTMYWTVTGKHVPTALPRGDSLLSRIDDNLIPRPKPASELNPRVPAKLNELVMHCVEINPSDRPNDMVYVAEQLDLIRAMILARQQEGDAKAKSGSGVGAILNAGTAGYEGMKLNEGSAPGTIPAAQNGQASGEV